MYSLSVSSLEGVFESKLKNMEKDKLHRLYLQVGQIQELLDENHIREAKVRIEQLRLDLQNKIY